MSTLPHFRTVATVLRQLHPDHEARAHSIFRANGGSSSRWARRDWIAMADAVTRLEDWLELERPRFDRTPLRTVRRQLEDADHAADAKPRRPKPDEPDDDDEPPRPRPRPRCNPIREAA